MSMNHNVFVAGATGYMGVRLSSALLAHAHRVTGLVRFNSVHKLPPGCSPAYGNALDSGTFMTLLNGSDTFVQLVGVAHPSPSKAKEFEHIDLRSCEESLKVAVENRVRHFVYVSVAHPAPMMKAFVEVRMRCEEMIRSSGLNATILRPWYVLGPGHYWPYLLKPVYAAAKRLPSTREGAHRLDLVTIDDMVHALVDATEHPPTGIRVWDVPDIKTRPVHAPRMRSAAA
ncbi:MAG TPA: NAD-dependent epimerase/dehydratase family protein [Terriglobales bacterium]